MKTKIFSITTFAFGLVTLFPCSIYSQNNNSTDPNKPVHLKIIKSINGVETVIDTVIAIDQVKNFDGGASGDFETNIHLGKETEIIIKSMTDTTMANFDSIMTKHLGKITDPNMDKIVKEIRSNTSGEPTRKVMIIHENKESSSKCDKAGPKSGMNIIIKKVEVKDPNANERKLFQKEQSTTENSLDLTKINLYPNPSNGHFNLSFDLQDKGTTDVIIYDIAGKILYQEQLKDFKGSYNKEIDIAQGSKGIYFLKVIQGKKTFLKKIALQ